MGRISTGKTRLQKIIKEEKKLYIERIKNELDNVKNMNEGWKFINKYKSNRDRHGTDKPKDTELLAHFKEALQGERPVTEEHFNMDGQAQLTELSMEDLDKALSKMKRRKAAGPDLLKAEAILYAGPRRIAEIRRILQSMLNGEELPR